MVKVGIMQPYFMPYIGYWQLLQAVDKFVILDDVNYIKKGWINRNQIIVNNSASFFTIPLVKASQNKLIKDIDIFEPNTAKEKLWRQLELAYANAQEYKSWSGFLKDLVFFEEKNLSGYIENSIRRIEKEFGMNTEILLSSELNKNEALRGEERILNICKILGADLYINPIGGKMLYHAESFMEYGMELKFIRMENLQYKQRQVAFIPNLSMFDVLFYNEKSKIQEFLRMYELVD